MSTHFTANQYENAFKPIKLGNYEEPSNYRQSPRKLTGTTSIIATDKGHLKKDLCRSKENPWGNFVGTWDLPMKIPGNCARVTTARTVNGVHKLDSEHFDASRVLSGKAKNDMRNAHIAMGNSKAVLTQATSSGACGAAAGTDTGFGPSTKMIDPTAVNVVAKSPLPQAGQVDVVPCKEQPVPGTPVRSPGPVVQRSPSPDCKSPQAGVYEDNKPYM